jgi:hypothetical protein
MLFLPPEGRNLAVQDFDRRFRQPQIKPGNHV